MLLLALVVDIVVFLLVQDAVDRELQQVGSIAAARRSTRPPDGTGASAGPLPQLHLRVPNCHHHVEIRRCGVHGSHWIEAACTKAHPMQSPACR